jgi:hypothetical protein
MSSTCDHYETLGVRPGAGQRELELAFKGRRSQYHPDRYEGTDAQTLAWATARMQQINEAFAVLSDPARRRAYDESRSARSRGAPSTDAQSQPHAWPQRPRFTLGEFLQLTTLMQGERDRVHIGARIPASKLAAACRSYGAALAGEEVVALVDATFFQGAERGALLTDSKIAIRTARDSCVFNLTDIPAVATEGAWLHLAHKGAFRLDFTAESELREVFHALDEYLHCRALAPADARGEIELPIGLLTELSIRHMGPAAFSGHRNCVLGSAISEEVTSACRFLLGLGHEEQVTAVCWIRPMDRTDCFVLTTRGVHTKVERQRTYLSWQQLKRLQIAGPARQGIKCGVLFSDGSQILCSCARMDDQVFAVPLFQEIRNHLHQRT